MALVTTDNTHFTPRIYNATNFFLTLVSRLGKGEKVYVRNIAVISNLKTTFHKMENLKKSDQIPVARAKGCNS